HRPRPCGRGRHVRRAREARRRRGRDGGRRPRVPGGDARGRAAHRGRAGRSGRAHLRRARRREQPRGDLPRGGRGRDGMKAVPIIVGYAFRESLRRRVFLVVLVLTIAFLILFWLGNHYAFRDLAHVGPPPGIDARTFAGAFIFGLAMFATLFLGVVLTTFLTLGVVRGDAERGLLPPLVVRP